MASACLANTITHCGINMKWEAIYNEKKYKCCPPGYYWVKHQTIITAETKEQALDKLKKGKHAVEIQKIASYE